MLLPNVDNLSHPNHIRKIDDRRSYQLKKLPNGEISALRMIDSIKPGRIRVVVPKKLKPQVMVIHMPELVLLLTD